jgi:hypothetical protein
MKIVTFLSESIDKVHKYYGTDNLADAMNHVHAEMLQFGNINWLPILEVSVSRNYLPENILDICMNYFLWKGDMKTSAEFARIIRFWRNKGLNEEWMRKQLIPLNDFIREFTTLEEEDKMRRVLSENIDKEICNNNTGYLYSGLKTLYYGGYLEKIMLLRIFYSDSILNYIQIWEFGIRKLKSFTPYNQDINQEWINVYFTAVGDNPSDDELFNHILPGNPSMIERRHDKFLVLGFNKMKGSINKMILFRQLSERKSPMIIWRNEMLVN